MTSKTFKERWEERDELCPTCGHITKQAKGLNKQNLKKLFQKPTANDIILFIITVLVLLGALAYQYEVQSLREILANPGELCSLYYSNIAHGNFENKQFNETIIIDIPWQNP